MNKKIIIAGTLLSLLLNVGCTSFIPRKDRSQTVEFKNSEINKEKYTIRFYKLEYPNTPEEIDKFYKEFDILTSKMLAYKKDINLIIPYEFYCELLHLKERKVRGGENIFSKPAFSLNGDEKKSIDEKISISSPADFSSIQKYLNKQVAYWYNYLDKKDEYNASYYYSEIDKDRLINEAYEKRKRFSNTSLIIEEDLTLEANNTNLTEVSKLGFPVYLKTNHLDVKELEELKPKIYVIDGNIEDTLIPNKILLINGKIIENIKDYKIDTVIKNIKNPLSLLKILEEDKGLKLKDIKDFSIRKIQNSTSKKASVRELMKERKRIEFKDSNSLWRIEK